MLPPADYIHLQLLIYKNREGWWRNGEGITIHT